MMNREWRVLGLRIEKYLTTKASMGHEGTLKDQNGE
jgi:hypothetical protein